MSNIPDLAMRLLEAIKRKECHAASACPAGVSAFPGYAQEHADDATAAAEDHWVENAPIIILRMCADHRRMVEKLVYYGTDPAADPTRRDRRRSYRLLALLAGSYGVQVEADVPATADLDAGDPDA